MRKDLYKYKDNLYIIHREIPAHNIDPQHKMLNLWREYLTECGQPIDKILKIASTNKFLFCETVKEAEIIQ